MSDLVCIYCRVSSDEQVQGTSLGSQEAACRAFAERNGWSVAKVFVELGESAKSADRPQFQAMVRFAGVKANRIGRVLVWKLDRFARRNYDFVVFQALLASAGVSIVSATEPAADGPAGKMMQSVLSVVAQFDNDVRAERTRTSMQALANSGFWCHSAPVGFRVGRVDGKPVLIPDPVTGPIVAQIFDEVAGARLSVADALKMVRARGLKTRGGRPFAVQTLHELLRSPVYAGFVEGKLTRGVRVPARFDGLVDVATWERVQMILSGRNVGDVQRPPQKLVRDEFPLRGVIRCHCGAPFTASWSRGRSASYGYYHCKNGCAGSRARIEAVHDQFRQVLRDISATHLPLMAAFREIVTRVHARRHRESIAMINQNSQRLRQLEEKASVLLDKLLSGTIPDDVYKAKNHEIQTEIAMAKIAVREADVSQFETVSALSLAEHMLSDLATIWERASTMDRLRFERAIFPDGITWSRCEGVRTAVSASVFSAIQSRRFDKSEVAPPTGCSSNQRPFEQFLAAVWSIRDLNVKAA